MSDPFARIDADFATPSTVISPTEFDPLRETLRILNRMLDVLERAIDERPVK